MAFTKSHLKPLKSTREKEEFCFSSLSERGHKFVTLVLI